jgi:2-phosphosulfolactate phosphatase
MYYTQQDFQIRCEWGLSAVEHLAPSSDVVVIVDVLSFTTCVEVAVSRGAVVYPFRWNDERAQEFAQQVGAIVAGSRRSAADYSLSPLSLHRIPAGTKLVLPSPNGSTLSLATGGKPTLAGCFRNSRAIAKAAQETGRGILVVPAGERWPDRSLRPAIEDLLAAGAIIRNLTGSKSPEALVAQAGFSVVGRSLEATLLACSSAKELIEDGFEQDVRVATQVDVSDCVPVLVDGAYCRRIA